MSRERDEEYNREPRDGGAAEQGGETQWKAFIGGISYSVDDTSLRNGEGWGSGPGWMVLRAKEGADRGAEAVAGQLCTAIHGSSAGQLTCAEARAQQSGCWLSAHT